jgi:Uma2 family endonuclease
VGNLHLLLRAACPPHLKVVLAPFAVGLADDTEVQPDLLVAPREQFTRRELPGPPLLAVEVLSPSTRRIDLLLKRDRYQAAGAAAYWLVDPEEPSVRALELREGTYVEVAHVRGDEACALSVPFPVRLVPSALQD